MFPYWLLFLVFAAGAIWSSLNPYAADPALVAGPNPARARPTERKGRGNGLLIAAAIAAAVLLGLRYKVGTDWTNYTSIFAMISHRNYLAALAFSDPAYATLNWASAKLGADIWLVNLVCGALLMFGVFRFAKVEPNPWLAIAAAVPYLLIVVGMGYTRQSVAIGLSMAGLAAISEGSFGRFVLWVLVAALFHRTAVLFIPLVAMAHSRDRLQTVVIGGLACVVGYFVLTRAEGLQTYEHLYINRAYESQGAGIRLAMNLPPALIFLAFSRRFTADETQRRLWRLFSFIALASFVAWLIIVSSAALDRLALYIIPLQLFVLSRIPSAFGSPARQSGALVVAVILYLAAAQWVWFTYATNAHNWIPYQFYQFHRTGS